MTELDTTTEADEAEVDSATLITQFEDAFDNSFDERRDSEQARDYYDGYQLTEGEIEALNKRGQPVVISNRIAPKIDALLGQEKRLRTDPKAYPRTPKHEDEANSVTDALRFVCESNNFDQVRSDVSESLMIEGIGAATVTVQPDDEGQMQVKITAVAWDRFYRDQHSRRKDFKDAAFMGVVLWMDEDDADRTFKGKKDVIQGCYAEGVMLGDTYDDRPSMRWGDRKRKRVRVLQHRFTHKGEWWTAIVCKGGYLRDPQPSPYVDEHGVPVCDLIAVSAYVDRENQRYGAVKRHISPQDEINKRRSKALHLLNSKQIIAEKGAVDDLEQTRKEAARPDGVMQPNPNMRFEVVSQPDLVAGQFQLLQESKAEIDISGVNPALSGDQSAPSGRAQEIQIQSALAEYSGIFDGLKHWSWEVYKQVWYRVRQYWTEERWVRVTDTDQNMRWVAINKPITAAEQMAQQYQQQGMPAPQLHPQDPAHQQQVGVQNQLAELDVDIIMEDAPDSVTIQSEQFQALVEMKKADPASIPTKAILQASSLRNKDQLIKALDEGGIPPQIKAQMDDMQKQLQAAQQQLQQAGNDQAKNQSDAQLKAAELEIKRYEAETERIVALRPAPLTAIPQGWPADGQTPGLTAHGSATAPPHIPQLGMTG